jgi:hypothetical protein
MLVQSASVSVVGSYQLLGLVVGVPGFDSIGENSTSKLSVSDINCISLHSSCYGYCPFDENIRLVIQILSVPAGIPSLHPVGTGFKKDPSFAPGLFGLVGDLLKILLVNDVVPPY